MLFVFSVSYVFLCALCFCLGVLLLLFSVICDVFLSELCCFCPRLFRLCMVVFCFSVS
jgi:hypothetical protein